MDHDDLDFSFKININVSDIYDHLAFTLQWTKFLKISIREKRVKNASFEILNNLEIFHQPLWLL